MWGTARKHQRGRFAKGNCSLGSLVRTSQNQVYTEAVKRVQGEVLIPKIFSRMYWRQFPQLPIPLSICSVHQPAINRTVSSIPKSLTQMTAPVKVIRESEELQSPHKVVPQCFCGLLGRGTDFFCLSACLCQRGRVVLEQEERLGLSLFLSP